MFSCFAVFKFSRVEGVTREFILKHVMSNDSNIFMKNKSIEAQAPVGWWYLSYWTKHLLLNFLQIPTVFVRVLCLQIFYIRLGILVGSV